MAMGPTLAAAQNTRKRRSRPMPCCGATTRHRTGEAFPGPRRSLCATPPLTREAGGQVSHQHRRALPGTRGLCAEPWLHE